ncbi:glutamate ligase domain-containing protein [Roseimaritima ulvae]|uniref:MurE-like ligase n=1 Tax=Roseimaritima ulvae TaxID=980254 RepID=A0A5B9QUE2_9BACT|nr:Mur ligase family protein [Roseimaritima ulvae]QEG42624.1 MurE-like ligase [Roseimaritima ulvae]
MVGTDSSNLRPASLRQLFPTARFIGGEDILVSRLATGATPCRRGDLVVIDCATVDPQQRIADALARGAAGILCEQLMPCPLPQCLVPDALAATALVADAIAGNPTRDVFTVGVIGQAGKTTTALLVAAALRAAGIRTAYCTDLGSCDGVLQMTPKQPAQTPTQYTQWLADTRDCGCATAVLELSDTMLANHCLEPLRLDLLVVTGNPGRTGDFGPHQLQAALDHLSPSGMAVVSADSPQALRMVTDAGVQRLTYGMRNDADVSGKIFEQMPGETTLLVTAGDTTATMETGLTGAAMAANQLAAVAVGMLTELTLPAAIEAIRSVKQIPGRMDRIPGYDAASVVLDVADSASRLSETLRGLRRERQGGRLWCVMAAPANAPEMECAAMGRAAERFADQVIYTSGEAGKESFLQSAHAMLDGVNKPACPRLVAGRRRAIEWAIAHAAPQDTIVVVGGFASTSPHAHRASIEADRKIVTAARQQPTTRRETIPATIPFPVA